MRRAPADPRKLLPWLGLTCGAAGLVLQFILSAQAAITNGRDVLGFLGHFFAFYTVLTNVVLVLIYLSEVWQNTRLAVFTSPVVRGLMAGNIALVGLYVYFVLRHLNLLYGLPQLADSILHYVCPLLYVLWWVSSQPHGQLRWSHLPVMLLPTLVYFAYILARGLWVQQYPYPILNVGELGYISVVMNAAYMGAILTLLMAAVITLDHFLTKRWNLIHD